MWGRWRFKFFSPLPPRRASAAEHRPSDFNYWKKNGYLDMSELCRGLRSSPPAKLDGCVTAGCTYVCDRRSAKYGRGHEVYVTGMWTRAWEDTVPCRLSILGCGCWEDWLRQQGREDVQWDIWGTSAGNSPRRESDSTLGFHCCWVCELCVNIQHVCVSHWMLSDWFWSLEQL